MPIFEINLRTGAIAGAEVRSQVRSIGASDLEDLAGGAKTRTDQLASAP